MENQIAKLAFTIHNLWILVATTLVFIMHLGFAALESGFTRSKNTVNILFKNVSVVSIGLLMFAFCGFNLMYPGDLFSGGFFGFSGFGITPGPEGLTSAYNPHYTYWSDFIFQAMFAATAGTIVSGAIAERFKLSSFLVFTTLLVGVAYPIMGMWKWGGGFLDTLATPFYDFAGSTIVHSIGGWAALVAIYLVGARIGKYDAKPGHEIKPHSFSLATIGMFLLWLGWFGFNGGSVLSAEPGTLSLVFVITALGGAAGIMGSMATSWIKYKRPDLANTLNGALAGLVGITAGADQFSPMNAVIIGGIAGILVVFAAEFFDKRKLDDPVGATSVHLVCGIWGTLAVGLFGGLASTSQFLSQLIGVGCIGIGTVLFTFIVLILLKKTMGLRVDSDHEIEGLG
jgi:Amt family ammonium transporter